MNSYVKKTIMNVIEHNTVTDKIIPAVSRQYTVSNDKRQELMTIINSWGTDTYEIWINGKNLLLYRYHGYNPATLDPEFMSFRDIVNCCNNKIMRQAKEKSQAQEISAARKNMTETETAVVAFLQTQNGKIR